MLGLKLNHVSKGGPGVTGVLYEQAVCQVSSNPVNTTVPPFTNMV